MSDSGGSPSSSPLPRENESAEQLTPRSKVRRMLSAFDDDDSDKENAQLAKLSPSAKRKRGVSPQRVGRASPKSETRALRTFDDSESDELAADTQSNDATLEQSAYQRIRGQLSAQMQKQKDGEDSDSQIQSRSGTGNRRSRTLRASSSSHQSPAASPKGLFVSPHKSQQAAESESDDENDKDLSETRSRLQELVARKRKEREEKEKAARRDSVSEDESPGSGARSDHEEVQRTASSPSAEARDDTHARKDKKQSRPARKASKKAIEEMNRETQRISRNMQLTHQAKTKKKFTTADLFKKMNFRQPKVAETQEPAVQQNTTPGSSSPARVNSDGEDPVHPDTPPSSPPSLAGSHGKPFTATGPSADEDHNDLPTFEDMMTQPSQPSHDKRQPRSGHEAGAEAHNQSKANKPSLRSFLKSSRRGRQSNDEDDDLEIVQPSGPSRIAALDNIQAIKGSEHQSVLALRALAHLNDSNHHRRIKGSVTPSELNAALTRRAREQAKVAELEKIQEAKDKGRYVESAEERERNQMQIESMIEKAQRENAELAKREKEAAKREGREEADGLPDSDEDEDFEPSDAEDVQSSGSEDEGHGLAADVEEEDSEGDGDDEADTDADEDGEQDDNDVVEQARSANPFVDFVDQDAEEDEENDVEGQPDADEQMSLDGEAADLQPLNLQTPKPKSSRRSRVVDDDESDGDQAPITPAPPATKTPGSKASIAQAFGFAQDKSPAVGLSQLWGGTMAESQTQQEDSAAIDSQQDSLAFLRGAPQVELPPFGETLVETQDDLLQDSQIGATQQTPARDSPIFRFDSQSQAPDQSTEASPMPDATQDLGFQKIDSPIANRRGPAQSSSYSTVDTVMLQSTETDSPIVKKKNHLHRGQSVSNVQVESSDHEMDEPTSDAEAPLPTASKDAFSTLKKGQKLAAKQAAFDKKKSSAKNMFEEQAEESEDEYAGLGGASDDDSGSEADEEVRKMLDDDSNVRLNRGKAAGLHAEWERARDEKNTAKLYRDITTGALRRQRDNGADLLDWDDEDEREARRRAMRLRKEARQRKALLDNGKLDEVVSNPKRAAFLSAVEDFAGDDEVMFLDDEDQSQTQSQSQSQSQSQPADGGLKRKRNSDEDEDEDEQTQHDRHTMPPPKSCRSAPRPSDIKRTLSELLDEPAQTDVMVLDSQDDVRGAYSTAGQKTAPIELDSDKENDSDLEFDNEEERERSPDATPPQKEKVLVQEAVQHHRRTAPNTSRAAVIDRMALKRQSSSTLTNNSTNHGKMAFTSANTTANSFKIPSLLRRATANASISSTEGSLAEKSAAAGITGVKREGTRMGGSKKSSINWHVRDQERKAKVERWEKERREDRVSVVRRSSGMGLGGMGDGRFE